MFTDQFSHSRSLEHNDFPGAFGFAVSHENDLFEKTSRDVCGNGKPLLDSKWEKVEKKIPKLCETLNLLSWMTNKPPLVQLRPVRNVGVCGRKWRWDLNVRILFVGSFVQIHDLNLWLVSISMMFLITDVHRAIIIMAEHDLLFSNYHTNSCCLQSYKTFSCMYSWNFLTEFSKQFRWKLSVAILI